MLDNLIRNAIRFSPEGSRVIIRVEESADPCTVSVRDFGPGIPEEIRGTLFEPLVQGPAEEGRGRGIGLGLTIAQSIAEPARGAHRRGQRARRRLRVHRDPSLRALSARQGGRDTGARVRHGSARGCGRSHRRFSPA